MAKPTRAKPKKRKPTREEVASAIFEWVNTIRSTLFAILDSVEVTRGELQNPKSPLRPFLSHTEVWELERDLSNSVMQAGTLFPENPLGTSIPTPLDRVKVGGK